MLKSPSADVSPAEVDERRRGWREAEARRRRRRRWRIGIGAVVLALLLPTAYSYTDWMLQPTSMPFGVRSVEWVRADVPFGNWIVDQSEHVYFSANQPRKGGPQLKSLPVVVPIVKAPVRPVVTAPRIALVFPHRLRGEGVWKPTGPPVDGRPPVLVTSFRPELAYPRIVAYVAWFDHTRTAIAFYPGRYEPPRAAVRGPMMVPRSQRSRLLATFNAGFIYKDINNGSTDNGRVNEPLARGNATLIGYRDGRIAIVKWRGGANAGPNVAWARQSLPPIVWNGQLNPALDNSSKWGYTFGNSIRVWRTGVGIDRHGNLLFAAADGQTVISLARILRRAGAVRAMQFDINPEWHTLISYTHRHGLVATKIGPTPMQPANRYLVPDDRDFFAVYKRAAGSVTVPFG